MADAAQSYRFGPFELDVLSRRLLRDGEPLAIAPKAFDLLLLLVEHRGRLLEKDELMQRLWPDTVVEEANLTQQIFMLRKLLGEQLNGKPYIETVARRGYLFSADLTEAESREESPALARRRLGLGLAAVSSLLIAGIVVVWMLSRDSDSTRNEPAASATTRTLGVLPFRSLNAQPVDEPLAMGMADAVITRLAQIRGVIVRPTGSVLKYAGSARDPLQIGRELKVEALLEGRFQRVGNRIRVSAQLINVGDGSSIWADHFDERFDDVFRVQDVISERVASAMAASLTREDRERLTRKYTENIEAYQLYLQGRYFWERRSFESVQKSIDYYQQAIAKDPAYALAYAAMADSYIILGNFSALPPGEAYPKAQEAAAKALEIDPGLAQAEIARSFATYLYDWDWDSAERGFKHALSAAPHYGPGHQWYAVCLVSRGKADEALAEIRRAQQVDPLSLVIHAVVAWIQYLNHDFDGAIDTARRTIEMDPTHPLAHGYLGMADAARGRYAEAELEIREVLARGGARGLDRSVGFLGMILARRGRTDEARKLLRDLQGRAKTGYVSPFGEALIRLSLGQRAEALTLLERAVDERYPWVIHFNVEPALDPLRDEPRFAALLRRVGIPEVPQHAK